MPNTPIHPQYAPLKLITVIITIVIRRIFTSLLMLSYVEKKNTKTHELSSPGYYYLIILLFCQSSDIKSTIVNNHNHVFEK